MKLLIKANDKELKTKVSGKVTDAIASLLVGIQQVMTAAVKNENGFEELKRQMICGITAMNYDGTVDEETLNSYGN